MPRRNRNVHTARIDAEDLAEEADRLAAELTAEHGTAILGGES